MYNSLTELLRLAKERGAPLWKIILENECALSGLNEQEVMGRLERRYAVMRRSAHGALDRPLPTAGSLISGVCAAQNTHSKKENTICGGFINRVMALALSGSEVNASMGKVCASPTAGSCGVLPAVLIGMEEAFGLGPEQTLRGLLTASGIGAVVMKNATVSGAEGGCQAECGVAAAMAAAAAAQMAGGTPEQALNACSLALVNAMGLVCDPIAGLVQVPCAQRNASQAVNALLSADLALAGHIFPIGPDEVVEAMYSVGRMLPPELRETALGGLAATPTARRIREAVLKNGGEKHD